MNLLKKLYEDRAAKEIAMTAIMTQCKDEKRARSAEEKKQWEALKEEADNMKDEIAALEEQERIDARSAKPVNRMRDDGTTDRANGLDEKEERTYLNKARTISLIDSRTKLANSKVKEELGLGELIVARIRGPQNEVEKRALDTSLDTAGGISTTVSRKFWDRTRAASVVVRAGASTLDYEDGEHGNVVIPQITGSIAPEWKAENVNVTLSDPTFTPRTLDFKTIMAGTKVSNELVQDSGTLLAQMIEADLSQSFASSIDDAALFGAGGLAPTGVKNTSGINLFTMGTNGNDLEDFNALVGGVRMLLDDNVPLSKVTGFIMSPREWEALATLKSATDLQQLIIPSQIAGIPQYVTSKVPVNTTVGSSNNTGTIFAADWSQLVIATRLSLKIRFFEQTFAQSFSTFISAVARVDIALVHPSSFVAITGITPGPALT